MYSSKSDHTLTVHLSKFLTPQAKMGSRGGGGVDPPCLIGVFSAHVVLPHWGCGPGKRANEAFENGGGTTPPPSPKISLAP